MSKFSAGKSIDSPEEGKKKTLSNGGGNGKMKSEGAGVTTGLSERYTCNVDENEPLFNTKKNPLTGNATERQKPRPYDTVEGGFQIES